jgi:hypothetical protein
MRALEAMVANQRSAVRHWRDNFKLRPREAVVNRRVHRRVQRDSVRPVQHRDISTHGSFVVSVHTAPNARLRRYRDRRPLATIAYSPTGAARRGGQCP